MNYNDISESIKCFKCQNIRICGPRQRQQEQPNNKNMFVQQVNKQHRVMLGLDEGWQVKYSSVVP